MIDNYGQIHRSTRNRNNNPNGQNTPIDNSGQTYQSTNDYQPTEEWGPEWNQTSPSSSTSNNRWISWVIGIAIFVIVIVVAIWSPKYSPKSVLAVTNATVIAQELNVRTGPSKDYSIQDRIYKNEKVEIIERYNDGRFGYVYSEYITVSRPYATVTAEALNVRSGPSKSYTVQDKMDRNNKVEVLEIYNNGWVKIRYYFGWVKIRYRNGKTGYVNGNHLTRSP